jgi:hypothetical protein
MRIAYTTARVPCALAPAIEQFVQMVVTGDHAAILVGKYEAKPDSFFSVAGSARKDDVVDSVDTLKILLDRIDRKEHMRDVK